VIVPWYDTEVICLILIVFMFVVFIFGFIGIAVAHETEEYRPFIWVPALVVALSGGVIVSTTIRLIRRYTELKNRSK